MKLLKTLAIAAAGIMLSFGAVQAAEGQKTAKDVSFSFEGPFGKFDRAQLQRGYKVYKEVCASCHSMHYVSFRNLAQPGGPEFTEEQVKVLAAGYTMQDGPNDAGDMFERPGLPSDRFPSPFANEQAARRALEEVEVAAQAPQDTGQLEQHRIGVAQFDPVAAGQV